MAVSLTQASYLEVDVLKKGIIDTIIYESPFMARMPFITIEGNAYKYNLESALGGAGWYVPGDTITEQTPTWAQRSVDLAELINDADVDKFIQQTRSSQQDVKQAVIKKAAKAMAYEFEKQAIRGYTSTQYSTKQMKGLMHLLAEVEAYNATAWDYSENGQFIYQTIDEGATLSLAKLDELIDLVKPGSPDCLLMTRRLRRALNTLARASGTNLRVMQDQWGKFIAVYNDIPVIICDWIPDNLQDNDSSGDVTIRSWNPNKTRAADYDSSIIFALKWGEEGICGLQNGGLTVEDLGALETKDADRTRLKWYCGMANFSKYSIAALINVFDAAYS